MSIEILESRIAPAAVTAPTINLITSGQSLKITGGTAADSIQISIGADSTGGVDIYAPSGTNFLHNGSVDTPVNGYIHLPTVLGSISVIGGTNGGSHVGFAPGVYSGNVTLNLGGSGNSVDIQAATIGGALTINTPQGGTSVTFDSYVPTLIGGSVKMLLGSGTNTVSVTTPQFRVAGSFSYVGGPAKLPSAAIGTNVLLVNQQTSGGLFSVAGSMLFNSKNAPGDVSIQSYAVNISKSLTIAETTSVIPSQPDTISGATVAIGGSLTWSSTGAQGFLLDGGGVSVAGKVTLSQLGNGLMKIGGASTSIGSLLATSKGNGGLQVTPATSLQINGGVKLDGLGFVAIQGIGNIGGSLMATNVGDVHIDDAFTIAAGSGYGLYIGGSVKVTVAPPSINPNASHSIYMANLVVGGSVGVTGNIAGDFVSLRDSRVFGAASFTSSQGLIITQDAGANQMLISGATTITLPAAGANFSVIDQNPPSPTPLFLGKTKIVAPFAPSDTFNYTSNLFASPVVVSAK